MTKPIILIDPKKEVLELIENTFGNKRSKKIYSLKKTGKYNGHVFYELTFKEQEHKDLFDLLASSLDYSKVIGGLYLEGCTGLRSLPDNLTITNGGLYLNGCTGLISLPDNLTISNGGLYLRCCTGLRSLPDNLTISNGGLYLEGCTGLRSLPDNLTIGNGSLDLSGCTGLVPNYPIPRGVDKDRVFI